MSQSGWEQGKDVIVNDERQPLLYDAKGQPLVRAVGFRSRGEVIAHPREPKASAP